MRFGQALAQAIKADTISLVMFEIGLSGLMAFVSFVLTDKLYPVYPFFLVYDADRYDSGFLHKLSCKLVVGKKGYQTWNVILFTGCLTTRQLNNN